MVLFNFAVSGTAIWFGLLQRGRTRAAKRRKYEASVERGNCLNLTNSPDIVCGQSQCNFQPDPSGVVRGEF